MLFALLTALTFGAPALTCGNDQTLLVGAMLGLWGDAEVECVKSRIDTSDFEAGEGLWRLLLVDARARGEHRRWKRLLDERELWRGMMLVVGEAEEEELDLAPAPLPAPVSARVQAIRQKSASFYEEFGEISAKPLGSPERCSALGSLAPRAARGELEEAERVCLAGRAAVASDESEVLRVLALLFDDAHARPGEVRVQTALHPSVFGVNCGDAVVYAAHEVLCDALYGLVHPPRER